MALGLVLGQSSVSSDVHQVSDLVFSNYRPPCRTLSGKRVPLFKSFSTTKKCSQRRLAVMALAMEATREAFVPSKDVKRLEESYSRDNSALRNHPPNNRADDVSLSNPLLRSQRMGCGWLGVIVEWEGVIVEDDIDSERKAWRAVAEEEGKSLPATFVLKRVEGMKNEQAISEVLCWSRDFRQIKRMALRKEQLYEGMQRGIYRMLPGSREFVETLKKYKLPVAVASTRPRKYVERAVEAVGMEGFFDDIVSAEDVYRGKPDPEMFLYAAERLGFISERCIVFGSSNMCIEAAHEACMKCVCVAGKYAVYELSAADLVVRKMSDISIVDLKNLADLDSPEFQAPLPEPEMEVEEEVERRTVTTADFLDDL